MDLLFFLKKVEDYECDIGGAKRTNWRNAKRTCLDWQAHLADGSQHWYLFCDVACLCSVVVSHTETVCSQRSKTSSERGQTCLTPKHTLGLAYWKGSRQATTAGSPSGSKYQSTFPVFSEGLWFPMATSNWDPLGQPN